MELQLWLSLTVICMLGALSPGPSLAVVIKNTLAGGTKQGYATSISHGLGVTLYAAITATGIGIIIVQSPLIFSVVQYAGAAFLLYLGIKALLSKKSSIDLSHQIAPNEKDINGWRAIFFLALFSQFVSGDASTQQKIIMTATVGTIDAVWYCLVTFALSRGNIIDKLKEKSHIVDKVTGTFLVFLAARVVLN